MSKRIAVCVLAGLSLAALPVGANAGRIVDVGQATTQPEVDVPVNMKPANAPDAGPTTAPATAPAISPEASALIDQTSAAYAKLKSLDLAGVLKVDIDAGDDQEKHSIDFTAAMSGHNHFRHENKDDTVAGGNDKWQYDYQKQSGEYVTGDPADPTDDVDDLMDPLPDYFHQADPSLLLALSNDPKSKLMVNVTDASRVADTKLDSQSYPTLELTNTDHSVETILLDPTTHLIRQVNVDIKPMLVAQGQTVKHALITVDYTTTTPNAQFKADAFDWTPPPGAHLMPDPAGAALALRGKPAPDFSLTYLDGKPVSLSDFKGKVVVLDFWATWCAPCIASLPQLDALYQKKKADGLEVLAVDAGEDAADVKAFVDKTKLGVPVVMDPDGKMRDAYSIEGFPIRVVIGKDGKVAYVSGGGGGEHQLQKAVDAALAAR